MKPIQIVNECSNISQVPLKDIGYGTVFSFDPSLGYFYIKIKRKGMLGSMGNSIDILDTKD